MTEDRALLAIERLTQEVDDAHRRYGDFTSTHEALGVLIEEVDELRAAIHANALASIALEAMQVAAVAFRLSAQCEAAMSNVTLARAFLIRSGISHTLTHKVTDASDGTGGVSP